MWRKIDFTRSEDWRALHLSIKIKDLAIQRSCRHYGNLFNAFLIIHSKFHPLLLPMFPSNVSLDQRPQSLAKVCDSFVMLTSMKTHIFLKPGIHFHV